MGNVYWEPPKDQYSYHITAFIGLFGKTTYSAHFQYGPTVLTDHVVSFSKAKVVRKAEKRLKKLTDKRARRKDIRVNEGWVTL